MCDNYDALPSIIGSVDRIVAIGDIHGDYDLLMSCLLIGGIYDGNDWIGGNTHVVQVGDQIDRCRPGKYECDDENSTIDDENSDVKILEFMTDLHKKALVHGGAVHSLLGNHEIMNVEGILSYVSPKGMRESGGFDKRRKLFMRGSDMATFLACTRNTAIIIGSNIFVHAGILPALANKYKELPQLNHAVRNWLLGKIDENGTGQLIDDMDKSPFWPRMLGSLKPGYEGEKCNILRDSLTIYGVTGMVVGHTPQYYPNNSYINSACSNQVWRIDAGMSKAFDSIDLPSTFRIPQVLEIINDSIYNIIKD